MGRASREKAGKRRARVVAQVLARLHGIEVDDDGWVSGARHVDDLLPALIQAYGGSIPVSIARQLLREVLLAATEVQDTRNRFSWLSNGFLRTHPWVVTRRGRNGEMLLMCGEGEVPL